MPRTDFGPEVKAGMQPNANRPNPPRAPRPAQNPGQQVSEEARDSSGNTGLPPRLPGPGSGGMPGMPQRGGMPPDAHHVAAASGIAHAILANRGLR